MTVFRSRSTTEPNQHPSLAAGPWLEQSLSQVVRTPLHSLLGFLELLSTSDLNEDQRRLHDELVDSAEELLSGSDRLLWLMRMLDGHYRPRSARVHLAAFAAEIAAASNGTVSDIVAPGAPTYIDTDLAALHQLVSELVSNARTNGGAPVVLAISAPEGGRPGARITVSDGGTGLPAGARSILTTPAPGVQAGHVGLVLVRRLADLLGVQVRLDENPKQIGAQIGLTLPASIGAGTPSAPGALVAAQSPARPLRVLLVEDNATNRLLTQRQLTRLGHAMLAVDTGRAGVDAALAAQDGTAPVDVILMDRHLPDIDGCEAARQIRTALPPDRPYLPIIAVTADATQDSWEACLASGMDEVLTKPVDLRQLAAALDRAGAAIDAGAASAEQYLTPNAGWLPETVRWILARVDGDPLSAAQLITTYLGELPGRRLRIQASLRRRDCRGVLAAAESLRTSSETVGAQGVAGACAALAATAEAGDLDATSALLGRLMTRCRQAVDTLEPLSEVRTLQAALDHMAD